MLDIFSGLRLVVKRRNINIDNAIFRCHWFFTSTLLVSFSLIITARQYVGQPIECHSTDKIPDSLLNSYCWVQSTFTVPQACNGQLNGLDVPYPCIDNARGREVKIYAYYQWVSIVLFIQGLLFHLPYYLWKLWENGLIKAITDGLRVAVLNEQERSKKKDIVVEYIHDHLGCHKRYAFKYFLCEFICLINLFGQLWATNRFFDGQFLRYGIEVMQYSTKSLNAVPIPSTLSSYSYYTSIASSSTNNNLQQSPTSGQSPLSSQQQSSSTLISSNNNNNNNYTATLLDNDFQTASRHSYRPAVSGRMRQQVDPMTFVFPRMTKCTYYDFGSSGDVQKHDALCLLPLNIINEKIYIALWFWFLILAILTILVIIYRMFAIVSESVRCKGLISRCKLSCERDIRLICKHCDVGDWFLFYMVAENLDPLVMREIVSSIASKINDHLELKRELKLQLEREEALERERLSNGNETDADKLRVIMANPSVPSSNLLDRLRFGFPPPPPPPPPSHQPAPSAPPRRDSFDPEYLANIFGQQSSSNGNGSRRGSFVDQIPQAVKRMRQKFYTNRFWSNDSTSGNVATNNINNNNNHMSSIISTITSASRHNSDGSTNRQNQNIHFEHAINAPANQIPLQSMPSTTSQHHTPVLTHRRAPRLQRRGSLNLLINTSQVSSSSYDSTSTPTTSDTSGIYSLSSGAKTSSGSCIMEMESCNARLTDDSFNIHTSRLGSAGIRSHSHR